MHNLHFRGTLRGLVFLGGFLQHFVEIGRNVHISVLVHLQIFKVAYEDSVHSDTNHVGDDVEDSERDDDGEPKGHGCQGTVEGIQSANCNKATDGGEQCFADKEDEASDGVHNHSWEEIARNKVEALTRGVAETVPVHSNINVRKFVDELHNALDAPEEALENRNEAHQKSVLRVLFFGQLQKEVRKLDDCQNQRSEGQRANGGGEGVEQGWERIFS